MVLVDDFSTNNPPLSRKKRVALENYLGKRPTVKSACPIQLHRKLNISIRSMPMVNDALSVV